MVSAQRERLEGGDLGQGTGGFWHEAGYDDVVTGALRNCLSAADLVPMKPGYRQLLGATAEEIVETDLRARGWHAQNLNGLAMNCPFVDLVAEKSGRRILVQVRGTTIHHSKWGAPPSKAEALDQFANALQCDGLYAFVWADQVPNPTEIAVFYAPAKDVAMHSQAVVDTAKCKVRYHVCWQDKAGLEVPLPV